MNMWRRRLAGSALMLVAAIAQAANDYVVAPSGGDITGAALSARLASGNVTLQSSAGKSAGSGNVIINDVVAWNSNSTLTLTGSNNVIIKANITASGKTSGMAISANTANGSEQAGGNGTYTLAGSITLSGANPSLTINGASYTIINSLGSAADAANMPATPTLQGMAATANLAKNFALGSNIDASATSSWNGGAGFTPIGSWGGTAFTGTLDGLGHNIRNLVIRQAPIGGYDVGGQVGLFGYADTGAVIRNTGLVACNIIGNTTGSNTIGGLVARHMGSISNSYVSGVVGSNNQGLSDSFIGGLVGINFGTIQSSYAAGSVSDSNTTNIGGLVASNAGNISASYSIASVSSSGAGYMGGLAGTNRGTISSSYALGAVTGSAYYLGGLVGYNCYNTNIATGCASQASITNSYAAVSAANGLVGSNEGAISNSYWNADLAANGLGANTGTTTGTGGLTTAQMHNAVNFVGFDFTTPVWVIVSEDGSVNNTSGIDGATFPILAAEYSASISNAHQLQLMAMQRDAAYALSATIDATATSGTGDIWGEAGFVPVGSYSVPFSGSLNGLGQTIKNLSISSRKFNRVGLFGVTGANASIQNLVLSGGMVKGHSGGGIGSLVGINNGTVSNCSASVTVEGTRGGFVGGLIGSNNGTINNSQASGAVNGTGGFRGGLVGINNQTIHGCSASGLVSGQGGMSGSLTGYNTGTINQGP